jgi:queuosine precursor transporter
MCEAPFSDAGLIERDTATGFDRVDVERSNRCHVHSVAVHVEGSGAASAYYTRAVPAILAPVVPHGTGMAAISPDADVRSFASLDSRSVRVFVVLAAFLACNALIAEFVGVKIFALEPTLGLGTFDWNLFGQRGSLSFTSGVLLWPFVFLLTDIINEYFGRRGVRMVSWLTVALIVYAFGAAYLTISLVPADFWLGVNRERGVPDMQSAFANIFGQGMWTISGSVLAFLLGQLIDVTVFHRIRTLTGERWVWLRATGSTAVSQLIDSFVVLYVAFVLGPQQWPTSLFLAVGTVNYGYKLVMAICLIPFIYLTRRLITRYLGEAEARRLQASAQRG